MHPRPSIPWFFWLLLALWIHPVHFSSAVDVEALLGSTNVLDLLDRRAAAEDRERLTRSSPATPPRAIDLHDLKQDLRWGRLERIESVAPTLLQAQPDDPQLNGLYGIFLATRGDLDAARVCMDKARTSDLGIHSARLIESLILRQQGEREKAVQAAQQAVNGDPAHPFAWNVLGRATLDAGDLPGALRHFQRAVELNERFYPGHLNVGAIALQLTNAPLAVTAFSKAAELEPQASPPRFGLALSLAAQGQYAAAIIQLREGLKHHPDDPLLLPRITELLLRTGQVEEAYAQAQRMERLRMPGSALLLADACLRRGDYAQAATQLAQLPVQDAQRQYLEAYRLIALQDFAGALTCLDQTQALNPGHLGAPLTALAVRIRLGQPCGLDDVRTSQWPAETRSMARFFLACDHLVRNETDAAYRQFQLSEGFVTGFSLTGIDPATLREAIPADSAKEFAIGMVVHLKGMKSAASDAFKRMLERHPKSFMAHYSLALSALESADRPLARQHLAQCLEQAPRFFPALYTLGELIFAAGDPSGATPYFERAQSVKADPGLALRLGLIHENAGKLVEAEHQYREVVRLAPEFFAGYNQLAWFLASRGLKLDEALQLAQRADALFPGNSSILDTLGWIHHLQQRPMQAVESLRRAAAANPANPTIWYHLAVVHQAAGNSSEALAALERALALPTAFNDRQAAAELRDKIRAPVAGRRE
jgi:tetratricopeptide (TPR) repeat protein